MKKMYGWATLNKKAFTLIELLAVIVILAIIALIATPIILNIIGDTKNEAVKRSVENYMTAIEQAIARENLNREFNPTRCRINSGGNLANCDGYEDMDPILVEVDGEKPTRGTIKFNKGKIKSIRNAKFGTKIINKNENEELSIQDDDGETGVKAIQGIFTEQLTNVMLTIDESKARVDVFPDNDLSYTFDEDNEVLKISALGIDYSFNYEKVNIENGVNKILYSADPFVLYTTNGTQGILPTDLIGRTYRNNSGYGVEFLQQNNQVRMRLSYNSTRIASPIYIINGEYIHPASQNIEISDNKISFDLVSNSGTSIPIGHYDLDRDYNN